MTTRCLIGVVLDCAFATIGFVSVPAKTSEAKDVATSFCIMTPFAAAFTTAFQL
jgi:hypothetical protein